MGRYKHWTGLPDWTTGMDYYTELLDLHTVFWFLVVHGGIACILWKPYLALMVFFFSVMNVNVAHICQILVVLKENR